MKVFAAMFLVLLLVGCRGEQYTPRPTPTRVERLPKGYVDQGELVLPSGSKLYFRHEDEAPNVIGGEFYFTHGMQENGTHILDVGNWGESMKSWLMCEVTCDEPLDFRGNLFPVHIDRWQNARITLPEGWEYVNPYDYEYLKLVGTNIREDFYSEDMFLHIILEEIEIDKQVRLRLEYMYLGSEEWHEKNMIIPAVQTIDVGESLGTEGLWVGYYPAILPREARIVMDSVQWRRMR